MGDLRTALADLLAHYVRLVESGDAGHWDAEAEPVVKRARAALDAGQAQPVATSGTPYNAEGWESLAWALCADEHGEDACGELLWEGGAVPEPWGERWLKYEGEAKRLIALVRKHAPAYTAPQASQPVAPAGWLPIETAPKDGTLMLGSDGLNVGAMWWAPEREPGYPWSFVGEWMGKAQDNAWQDGEHGPTHWMPLPAAPGAQP